MQTQAKIVRISSKLKLALAIPVFALTACQTTQTSNPPSNHVWLGPGALWRKIEHSAPIPVPPEVAASDRGGVTVTWLSISENGKVTDVSVLETPHAALGEALKTSLQSWRFSMSTIAGKPVGVAGKVILYLETHEGSGRLLTRPEALKSGSRVESTEGEGSRIDQLLDVRSREEYRADHAPQALNFPIDELQFRGPVELDPAAPVRY